MTRHIGVFLCGFLTMYAALSLSPGDPLPAISVLVTLVLVAGIGWELVHRRK